MLLLLSLLPDCSAAREFFCFNNVFGGNVSLDLLSEHPWSSRAFPPGSACHVLFCIMQYPLHQKGVTIFAVPLKVPGGSSTAITRTKVLVALEKNYTILKVSWTIEGETNSFHTPKSQPHVHTSWTILERNDCSLHSKRCGAVQGVKS